ncbi:MAG: GPW/gp25 family protein [Lachnospiraceae bacterium]|nr:GPW/gp25 family protein [Lachnospiraceae bacterium]
MAGNKSYLGTGCKFPLQIDPATGRFMTVSGNQSVKESLYLILMTQRTERLVRPSFGSNMMDYTFMDTGTTMMSILKRDLSETILEQEPRISDLEIETQYRERQGAVIISINYRVAGSNTRDNLVFPFYLDRGAENVDESEEYDIINEDDVRASYYGDEDDETL